MSYLREVLNDALAGRRLVNDGATFELLRRNFPDHRAALDHLEGEAIARRTIPTISAIEKIYRELKKEPSPPPPPEAPAPAPEPVPEPELHLTAQDANDVISGRRKAALPEIEWLLQHATEFSFHLDLTDDQIFNLRQIAARLSAKAIRGTRPAATEQFIIETLGSIETPYGLLERGEVQTLKAIQAQAARAIADCPNHVADRCPCWLAARDSLYELRCRAGEKSPMGAAALKLWTNLEALAVAKKKPEAKAVPRDRISEQGGWQPWKSWSWHAHRPGYHEEQAALRAANAPPPPNTEPISKPQKDKSESR